MTRGRKWVLRVGLVACVALVGAGVWAAMNWAELKAMYAARQLRHATTDEDRTKFAERLANLGEPGLARLADLVCNGNETERLAAVAVIDQTLTSSPDGDPRAVSISAHLLGGFSSAGPDGQHAILALLPAVLAKTGTTHVERVREVVATGLKLPDASARVVAVRVAIHPEVRMRRDLLPLLVAPEPDVRQVALFAVASATDGELITDEELFGWLHDPDGGVRAVCRDALIARGRTEAEITLGGRLVAPDPRERLKLLLDLRYDDVVVDPEPWLERLSRDPEPAVRAGAARVAIEVSRKQHLACPGWVAKVAEADANLTVRRIAAYFQREAAGQSDPNVRPAGKK